MERGAPLVERLVARWPVGMAVALGLAFIPVLNWLGLALAVLLVLRHGGGILSLGYALVAVASYFTIIGYNVNLVLSGWHTILAMYLPLLAMAWFLRASRSLSFAIMGGILVFMGLILVLWLINGPPDLNAWMAYFNCRLEAAGLTQSQLVEMVPGKGVTFEEMVKGFMLTWPLSTGLLQMGILFVARWQQARIYNPGGFARDFHGLKLPKTMAFFLAGLILVTMFAPDNMVTLLNIGMLAVLLMGVTGLGFVHGYLADKHRSRWWLVLVYLLMLFNLWVALLLLATLALLDSGFNLKERVR